MSARHSGMSWLPAAFIDGSCCPDGDPPRVLLLGNGHGFRLALMDWGATWLSCQVPVSQMSREVVLGCQRLEDYLSQRAFLGATIGRYANRIGGARFVSGGRQVNLQPNEGLNQLHGGPEGFSSRRWDIVEVSRSHAVMHLESPDGDQGFPGNLDATVCFRVSGASAVSIEYEARVDAPCPVNLTNHAYFNLDGAVTDVRRHRLEINARHFVPVASDLIPLGSLAPVAGTSFDFTRAKPIGQDFLADEQQRIAGGYDHAFLLDPACRTLKRAAATLVSADGRLAMDVFTTKPAMQFYSGNRLNGVANRDGLTYAACQGLALEPEFLPDSPNQAWPQPDCWLNPGERYRHKTVMVFRLS